MICNSLTKPEVPGKISKALFVAVPRLVEIDGVVNTTLEDLETAMNTVGKYSGIIQDYKHLLCQGMICVKIPV